MLMNAPTILAVLMLSARILWEVSPAAVKKITPVTRSRVAWI